MSILQDSAQPPRSIRKAQARFRTSVALIASASVALLASEAIDFSRIAIITFVMYGLGILTFICMSLFIQATIARKKNVSARELLRNIELGDIALGFVGFLITLSAFTIFKSQIIGSDGFTHDATFIQWDRAILGTDAWKITHALWPSSWITALFDKIYYPLFVPMFMTFVLALVAPARPRIRYTYIATYLTSFVVIGMILAHLMASAGPIYDGLLFGDGTTFGPLIDQLTADGEVFGSMSFLQARGYLYDFYSAGWSGFGTGISAMPSMHVVLALICVFPAWHIGKVIGAVTTLYALLIWAISVHLGWHYFVDGLVGGTVAALIWVGFGYLFGLYRQGGTP